MLYKYDNIEVKSHKNNDNVNDLIRYDTSCSRWRTLTYK